MKRSKTLRNVHDTIKGLHKIGVVPITTMRKFDRLCLPKIHKVKPSEIKKIRNKEHVSQAVFAAYLNISPSTIQQWEAGEKYPSGAALKLLNLVEKNGLCILE